MKKTKLSLNEIYVLSQELSGNENFKGLLSQPLALKVKYWLQRLMYELESEIKTIDQVRNDLIKELGHAKDDTFELSPESENFPKFVSQVNQMMSEEKEINHAIFKLSDFDAIETAEHYGVFLKLIDIDEEVPEGSDK